MNNSNLCKTCEKYKECTEEATLRCYDPEAIDSMCDLNSTKKVLKQFINEYKEILYQEARNNTKYNSLGRPTISADEE